MTKQVFLDRLQAKLSGLPRADVEDRLTFYREMIDDRIEDGIPEEQAVCEIGTVDDVAAQIIADIPLLKVAKEKIKPSHRLRAGEITLLCLGSPLWLPLLLAAVAVILSLYVSLWAIILSLWAVFAALVASAIGTLILGVGLAVASHLLSGIALIGTALVCAGLSIFAFFGCKATTTAILKLTKTIAIKTKHSLIRKEAHHE